MAELISAAWKSSQQHTRTSRRPISISPTIESCNPFNSSPSTTAAHHQPSSINDQPPNRHSNLPEVGSLDDRSNPIQFENKKMCYKIPHLWTPCNHTCAWSPVHCVAATARNLAPSEHCEQLIEPEDPGWVIKEGMVCPDCQRKAEEGEDGVEEGDGVEKGGVEEGEGEKPGDNSSSPTAARPLTSFSQELATLEHALEDLELQHLDAALHESLHQHTLLHETALETARQNSLADAPEQQSLERHVEEMARAKEASVRHWEEELGVGVYRDHERAVQRARVESYRELLEGYKRLKERVGNDGGGGGGGEEVVVGTSGAGHGGEAGPSTPRASSIATTTTKARPSSPAPRNKQRWPFQDDDHRQLYEGDDNIPPLSASSSRVGRFREGVALDPAESFAGRPTSHASSSRRSSHQPAAGDEAETTQQRVQFPAGDDGHGEGRDEQRHRRRSLLKRLRPGGSNKK